MSSHVFHYQTKKDPSHNGSDEESVQDALHNGILPVGFFPADTDILCGRGKAFSNHPGNKKFSDIVRDNLQRYVDAPKRAEKSMVVASVVAEITTSGTRFVKKEKSSGRWYQMNQDQMHEKTGHAIRDLIKSYKIEFVHSKNITTKSTTSKRRRSSKRASKSSQAKKSLRRTSRRSSASMEPINALSEAFCHSTFQTDMSRSFSMTTIDVLSKVLEVQDIFYNNVHEEEIVPSPPALKPVVMDGTFPDVVTSSAPVLDVDIDLDAQEIFASSDFLLGEDDDDLIDIISVSHNEPTIVDPIKTSNVPASITVVTTTTDIPDVSANDFAKVYELLSSDDESSVEERPNVNTTMAAAMCC